MKTIRLIRHSKKEQKPFNRHISEEGFELAATYIPSLFPDKEPDHLFHSVECRAAKTAYTAALSAGWNNAKPHLPILQLGGDALFEEWVAEGIDFEVEGITFIEMAQRGMSDFEARCAYLAGAAAEMFAQMDDGELALGVGHGLLLEMIFQGLGYPVLEDPFDLRELEGAEIVMDDEGTITVTRRLKR